MKTLRLLFYLIALAPMVQAQPSLPRIEYVLTLEQVTASIDAPPQVQDAPRKMCAIRGTLTSYEGTDGSYFVCKCTSNDVCWWEPCTSSKCPNVSSQEAVEGPDVSCVPEGQNFIAYMHDGALVIRLINNCRLECSSDGTTLITTP